MTWIGKLTHGDLGTSFSRRRPVSELIATAFTNTVILASAAAVLGLSLGIGLGALAALRPGSWPDRLISFRQ